MTEPERDLLEQLQAVRAGMRGIMAAIRAHKTTEQPTALRSRAYWQGYEDGMNATLNAVVGIVEDEAKARGVAVEGEPRSASVLDVHL